MRDELRLNPRSPEARSADCRLRVRALTEDGGSVLGLSTAFAEGLGPRFHSRWGAVTTKKEGG